MKSLLNLAEFLKFMSFFSDDISRPLLLVVDVVEKDILFFVCFIHSVLNMLIKVKGYVPIRSMLLLHRGDFFEIAPI